MCVRAAGLISLLTILMFGLLLLQIARCDHSVSQSDIAVILKHEAADQKVYIKKKHETCASIRNLRNTAANTLFYLQVDFLFRSETVKCSF